MLATTVRRSPAAAARAYRHGAGAAAAAGATRCKSAVAAESESIKNFKIYRWDPNEKVSLIVRAPRVLGKEGRFSVSSPLSSLAAHCSVVLRGARK